MGIKKSMVCRKLACQKSAALFAALTFVGSLANAAAPSFTQIDSSDLSNIVKDLSANNSLHTVMPASSMGSIFGIELGIATGLGKVPNINSLTKQVNSGTSVELLPHAGIVGAVSIPMGLSFEAALLPSLSGDISYSHYALAAKYNMDLPFMNLAVKGFYTSTKLSFTQRVTDSVSSLPVDAKVEYDNTITGVQLLASPSLPMLEPYAGLGFVNSKGNLALTGATVPDFFTPSFTTSQAAEASPSTVQMLLGVNLRLALLVVGAEYQRLFDTETYTAKVSLRF